jgi:hypothetical protein
MSERDAEVALEMDLDETLAEEEESEQWAPEEAPDLSSHLDDEWRRRWVIQREGKDHVLYAGLLDLLHLVSKGRFQIYTHLEQAPTEANGMLAIVEARVELLGTDETRPSWGSSIRQATGIGDASPQSVNRMMAPHLVRLAETRAKGRALRDLLNIGLVTVEELGPSGPNAGSGAKSAPTSNDPNGIVIAGTRYTREEVWKAYQGRMTQMRDARLPIPNGAALGQNAPLSQLAGATQRLKKALADAGKLPPANGRNN